MALRLDRIYNLGLLYCVDRPYRCNLSHWISCARPVFFRNSVCLCLALGLTRDLTSFRGSLWPVLNRAAMACIWYGVQSWIGGTCVYLIIRSIWSKFNHEDVHNGLPASSGTNTVDFLSFFLFWLCSLPAIWFPVHKIRHLFTVKAYIVPVAYALPGTPPARASLTELQRICVLWVVC